MATKKNMTEDQLHKSKSSDAVVYKVMIALALLCAALFALRSLRRYYATIGGFAALYDRTPWLMAGGAALAVVALLLAVFWKNRVVRAVCPWFVPIGVMAAVTGLSMRIAWVDDFPMLYFLCLAVLVQYIVFQLYRWEFFLVSFCTVAAGGLFFGYSGGFTFNLKSVCLFAGLMVILVGSALCAFLAARNKGCLVLGKQRIRLFPSRFNPILVYAAAALWFCCAIAVLLLGSLFAYYCMFAAIAVEFIAAVYYTFQLN